MSTRMTFEIEVDVDVSRDVLGMWVAQQLNHCETADTSAMEDEQLGLLDDYSGHILVAWR